MTLSELFGDGPSIESIKSAFISLNRHHWSSQIDNLMMENRGPKIRTKIIVKKGKVNG